MYKKDRLINMSKVRIKGKKKLNKAITKEVAPFGISSATLSDEYAYYYTDESMTFKLTQSVEDEWFNEFIKERFGYECEYSFVLSLLHEIGHHKANNEIDGAILDFCNAEKDRINSEMILADADKSKVLEWQYFNLPDEIMATQWAVNYAKKHPRKIKKMWERMKADIMEFYLANGLEDNTEEL